MAVVQCTSVAILSYKTLCLKRPDVAQWGGHCIVQLEMGWPAAAVHNPQCSARRRGRCGYCTTLDNSQVATLQGSA
jgi:hypothetical protein